MFDVVTIPAYRCAATCAKVFDLVTTMNGAPSASQRESFLRYFTQDERSNTLEFRIGGKLGFGGKLTRSRGRWQVSAYSEDLTPERQMLIDVINDALIQYSVPSRAVAC